MNKTMKLCKLLELSINNLLARALVVLLLSSGISPALAAHPKAGIYMGNFGGLLETGGFAVFVGTNGQGVMVGFSSILAGGLYKNSITVNTDGTFAFSNPYVPGYGMPKLSSISGTISGSSVSGQYTSYLGPGTFSGSKKSNGGVHYGDAGVYYGNFSGGRQGEEAAILAADGTLYFYALPYYGTDDGGFGTVSVQNVISSTGTLGFAATGTLDPISRTLTGNWTSWGESGTYSASRTYSLPPTTSADLNGDGADDLLLQNSSGALVAWLMNGHGQIQSGQTIYSGSLADWKLVALADVNSDGNPDLIFQNGPGQIATWFMNSQGQPTTGTTIYGGTGLADWRIVAAADLNSDGRADLVFQNAAGSVAGWLMDGQGHATTGVTIYGATISGWKVATMGDVNGDGIADLIWQTSLGSVVAWLMDGQGHPTAAATIYGGTLAGWQIAGVKDLNGDGIGDLLWQSTTGSVLGWLMDGHSHPTTALNIYTGSLGDWRVH